jgi:L-Ala-D/L-Glu epimerase
VHNIGLGFTQYALSSPMIEHYDFDTAMMHSQDYVSGGIAYKANGVVEVPDAVGLGAMIENKWLEEMEKIIV